MERYHIVIDTLGSDKGPTAILEGAKLVLEENDNIDVTLVGDEEVIKSANLPSERIKIIHAPETVTNYDNPIEAFYNKKLVFQSLKQLKNVLKMKKLSELFLPVIQALYS